MTTTRPTQVTIDAYGLTDTGKVRKENEDHFLVADVSKRVDMLCGSLSLEALNHRVGTSGAQLLVVADGVVGGPELHQASERTADAVLTYVGKSAGCFLGLGKYHAIAMGSTGNLDNYWGTTNLFNNVDWISCITCKDSLWDVYTSFCQQLCSSKLIA